MKFDISEDDLCFFLFLNYRPVACVSSTKYKIIAPNRKKRVANFVVRIKIKKLQDKIIEYKK